MENKDKILVIVPSRTRPDNIQRLIAGFLDTTSGASQLLIGLDDDDPQFSVYSTNFKHEAVEFSIGPRCGSGALVNQLALQHLDYGYVSYLGDDIAFGTVGWDKRMIDAIQGLGGTGIAYANDLYRGVGFTIHIVASMNIVRALGYLCVPTMKHLYVDDVWKLWGDGIGKLVYLDDVIIEHKHWSNGKASLDALYSETNSDFIFAHDEARYNEYCNRQLAVDLVKLKALL
jgi:hypothetical protein